ncbi:lamin tail domain-containing protein [Streptomyces sp. NPDC020298]|uniref:lamin tail domain-containing protein n=1 Tax=unclassified Streptomyces TaxID=2593676 RepID=UPI0033E00526
MSVSVSVTARRVAAAAAAAAALVGAVALPASAAGHDHDRDRSRREHVVISAVQYDSPGRDDRSNRSLNKEWVDVTNNSRQDVNLDGWTLSDEDGHTYTFHHYRLDGRSTVRIHTGEGRDRATDLYQDRRQQVWNNDHDTATLRNDHGRFVDDYSWGGHHHNRRG